MATVRRDLKQQMPFRVSTGIAGSGQLEDASADRLRETVWRWSAPVAMGRGLEPRAADAGEEPAHLAQRDAQKQGSLPGTEGAGFDPGRGPASAVALDMST